MGMFYHLCRLRSVCTEEGGEIQRWTRLCDGVEDVGAAVDSEGYG